MFGSRTSRPASAARRRGSRRAALGIALFPLLLLAPAAGGDEKVLYGWVERVLVGESRLHLKAKLDTGAETSSLDATRIRRYKRGGDPWIQFTVTDQDSGRTVVFRKPLQRQVRIKRHERPHQRRPVVVVPICLGELLLDVEVSLIDRSEFLYPVLLGRSVLEGLAVVDPELTFTTEPSCPSRSGTDDEGGEESR